LFPVIDIGGKAGNACCPVRQAAIPGRKQTAFQAVPFKSLQILFVHSGRALGSGSWTC